MSMKILRQCWRDEEREREEEKKREEDEMRASSVVVVERGRLQLPNLNGNNPVFFLFYSSILLLCLYHYQLHG